MSGVPGGDAGESLMLSGGSVAPDGFLGVGGTAWTAVGVLATVLVGLPVIISLVQTQRAKKPVIKALKRKRLSG